MNAHGEEDKRCRGDTNIVGRARGFNLVPEKLGDSDIFWRVRKVRCEDSRADSFFCNFLYERKVQGLFPVMSYKVIGYCVAGWESSSTCRMVSSLRLFRIPFTSFCKLEESMRAGGGTPSPMLSPAPNLPLAAPRAQALTLFLLWAQPSPPLFEAEGLQAIAPTRALLLRRVRSSGAIQLVLSHP